MSEPGHRDTWSAPAGGWPTFDGEGRRIRPGEAHDDDEGARAAAGRTGDAREDAISASRPAGAEPHRWSRRPED